MQPASHPRGFVCVCRKIALRKANCRRTPKNPHRPKSEKHPGWKVCIPKVFFFFLLRFWSYCVRSCRPILWPQSSSGSCSQAKEVTNPIRHTLLLGCGTFWLCVRLQPRQPEKKVYFRLLALIFHLPIANWVEFHESGHCDGTCEQRRTWWWGCSNRPWLGSARRTGISSSGRATPAHLRRRSAAHCRRSPGKSHPEQGWQQILIPVRCQKSGCFSQFV